MVGLDDLDEPIQKSREVLAKLEKGTVTPPPTPVSRIFPRPRRERTASLPYTAMPPRQRRLSHISICSSVSPRITLDISKATMSPASPCNNQDHMSIGAFSPTSSAKSHLRNIINVNGLSAEAESQSVDRERRISGTWFHPPKFARTWSRGSGQIPSISRSPSCSVSFPSSPVQSKLLIPPPPSPSLTRPPSRRQSYCATSTGGLNYGPSPMYNPLSKPVKIDPLLMALENASRLRSRVVCVACNKTGSDFPRCPRCGDAWCSRECRVVGKGGKLHVCRSTTTC